MPPTQRKQIITASLTPIAAFVILFFLLHSWQNKTNVAQQKRVWIDEPASSNSKNTSSLLGLQLAYTFLFLPFLWLLQKFYRALFPARINTPLQ
ncbi:hypothetical protein K439DRAFT_1626365 [Ramaria rubella]|nr:hypothetical protein K439DRAFT_1626365 [Ramaria rubella]